MAIAEHPSVAVLYGHATPRIAPPLPLRHDLAGYREFSTSIGIDPMPWQDTAAMYATARGPDHWLYREVAVIVARQNGKTTFTKPLIIRRLLEGRKIMHIAQVRELPRVMFETIADVIEEKHPDLLPRRRGKVIWPRRGAGSESIVLTNGGEYRIAAAITGGRGFSFDDLLIDELREMETFAVIDAAKHAQKFSEDPQMVYLSNMGTDKAVILNSLGKRAGYDPERGWVNEPDPSLAYLEWSADPEYDTGDIRGWVQANPAIGHYPQVLRDLEQDYRASKLAGNLAGFETEALCRKVATMRERLVDEYAWLACEVEELTKGRRPVMGVSMDPSGKRASAAMAWQEGEQVGLRMIFEATGDLSDPIPLQKFGTDLRTLAGKLGIREVAYDPLTDRELAKFFPKTKASSGQDFVNATGRFETLVRERNLRWQDCAGVTEDLTWTAKKPHEESGSFQAVRANDDRPITAALAAIRAVWLASGPTPIRPKVM